MSSLTPCYPRRWRSYEGRKSPEVSAAATGTGLQAGTPVVGGGGDQAAQAVGVGAITPGIVALTLGTSGGVFASTGGPFIEPEGRLHAFCHSVPHTWHLMGVMLSAAGSLQWHRDTLAPSMSFDQLLAPAAQIPAGAEGLLFLPYLSGERTPHPDPLARAAFVGLTLRHGLAHMTRAVLEGVAFGLRDSMELLLSAGLGSIQQVRVSGGGARSSLWRQILADVLDAELVTINLPPKRRLRCGLLTGVGAGWWATVAESCQAAIRIIRTHRPHRPSSPATSTPTRPTAPSTPPCVELCPSWRADLITWVPCRLVTALPIPEPEVLLMNSRQRLKLHVRPPGPDHPSVKGRPCDSIHHKSYTALRKCWGMPEVEPHRRHFPADRDRG
jgi:hypothetical protein